MSDLKFDALASEFEIEDRAALGSALSRAMVAMVEKRGPDFREADSLDELDAPLGRIIDLLGDVLNGNRLALYWRALPDAGESRGAMYIPDFVRDLKLLRRSAAEAHRERDQARGKLPRADLRAAVDVLYQYWVDELQRLFTRDHRWTAGQGGQVEPVTPGERFIWRGIAYFSPESAAELQAALRAIGA